MKYETGIHFRNIECGKRNENTFAYFFFFDSDDEGQDLFTKRGNEFKLPYPLLDLDMCTGFGFGDEDLGAKSKSNKSKKKGGQGKDCGQNGKKRKGGATPTPAGCIINGIANYGTHYPTFNAYEAPATDFKAADFLYPYGSNSYSLEPDLYRSHGYGAFTPSVYHPVDTYRLDSTDKHGLSNGYFPDHRQYQLPLPYSSNAYSDVMGASAKYGYDVPKYGLDTYSLDLTKRMGMGEDVTLPHPSHPPPPLHAASHMEAADGRGKFVHEFHPQHDRYTPRVNGSGLEPVDLRSPMFGPTSFMNTVEGSVAPPCVPPALFKGVHHSSAQVGGPQAPPPPPPPSNLLTKDPKLDKSLSVMTSSASSLSALPPLPSADLMPAMTLSHNTVIKSTSGLHDPGVTHMHLNVSTASLTLGSGGAQTPPSVPHTHPLTRHHPSKACDVSAGSPWNVCPAGIHVGSGNGANGGVGLGTPNTVTSPCRQQDLREDMGVGVHMNGTQEDHHNHGNSSPKTAGIPASVIQSR